MNRRFGPKPDPDRRYQPRMGAYAIVLAGDGILATFQQRPTPEMQLPGGGVDPGESAVRALHREVLEETGYRIHAPRRLGMFHRFTYMPDYEIWAQKQCHVYLARLGPCVAVPSEPGHIPVFLPWNAAEARLGVEGDRHFVGQVRRAMGL